MENSAKMAAILTVKGIVHPKIKTLSSSTHGQVVPKPGSLSS